MNLADSKKFCDINSTATTNAAAAAAAATNSSMSLLFDKFKNVANDSSAIDYLKNNNGDVMNAVNNNNTITNNNASVKSERLSPAQIQSQHNGGNGDAQSFHSRYLHIFSLFFSVFITVKKSVTEWRRKKIGKFSFFSESFYLI